MTQESPERRLQVGGETFAADLQAAFGRLLGHGDLRARLSETSAALCDGQGATRAAKAVLERTLNVDSV